MTHVRVDARGGMVVVVVAMGLVVAVVLRWQ